MKMMWRSKERGNLTKLLAQVAEPTEDNGDGVPELDGLPRIEWLGCLSLQQLTIVVVVGSVVIGALERKLLTNDSSKKVSFL